MKVLDLRKGLSDNEQYKGFLFHGGEVHFKLKDPNAFYLDTDMIKIVSSVTNSDELMLLILAIDTIRKDGFDKYLEVFIPYMPYQQADRDFSLGECFSLKTVTNILNSLDVNKYIVYDAHSDVSPALLKNSKSIDNSDFISLVIGLYSNRDVAHESLCIISPDAGAYKKIGKLCAKIDWEGELVAANKYRSISTGNIESLELSKDNFEGKDVLIIDDICVGGRTFIELGKKLKEKGAGNLYLAISHGVFSNGFKELNQHFDGIFVTNSRKDFLEDPEFTMLNDGNLHKLTVINIL